MEKYDSIVDTKAHKSLVEKNMKIIIDDLKQRSDKHDDSKLKNPEKEGYDKYVPMLKEAKYGSEEYNKIRKAMMDECLSHHFEVNRHHPEHFKNGIKDFTIVDLIEYFIDTYSASMKSDTEYEKGLKINAKKHNLPDAIVEIFKNTVKEYFN